MRLSLLILLNLTFIATSFADRGYEIAKSVEAANTGFIGDSSEMEMHLINGQRKIKRSMFSSTSEITDDETRALLEFQLPKDVKGTKLLTWSFDSKEDSQWIYLPAFKKTKRISSSSKTSSFMGSEFTFEDLRANPPEKYEFKFIKEEKKADDTYWTIERKSKKESGYSKQILTISKKYMNSVFVEYFDRSGELLKKATISDFKVYNIKNKKIWAPSKIEMKNIQTQKESILFWKNRVMGNPIKSKTFAKNSLKK